MNKNKRVDPKWEKLFNTPLIKWWLRFYKCYLSYFNVPNLCQNYAFFPMPRDPAKELGNKSPKGHWSLTWVQWALLLKVRFLSKSESMTAIFVKSVRTATIAIFQFRIRGCIRFVAVAFRSEEEVLWRRNPSLTYFWQIAPPPPGSAPGWSLPKSL